MFTIKLFLWPYFTPTSNETLASLFEGKTHLICTMMDVGYSYVEMCAWCLMVYMWWVISRLVSSGPMCMSCWSRMMILLLSSGFCCSLRCWLVFWCKLWEWHQLLGIVGDKIIQFMKCSTWCQVFYNIVGTNNEVTWWSWKTLWTNTGAMGFLGISC